MHVHVNATHLKEGLCTSGGHTAVFDFGLFCQVFGSFNWRHHLLNREKSCQVSGVGGNNNECKKPPDSGHHPSGHCSRGDLTT